MQYDSLLSKIIMLPCHVVARRFVIAPVQRMHGCTATSNYEQPNFSDFFRLLNLSKNKYAGPPDSRTKIYAARASCGSSSCMSIDICCPRPTSAANPPAAAAAVDRRDRRTDTRQFFFDARAYYICIHWCAPMECCRVDDTLPERAVTGLSPG